MSRSQNESFVFVIEMVFITDGSHWLRGCSLLQPHQRSAVTPFARVYLSLSVYPIRTDCLCLVDSMLFTFVYVNDGWVHDETFDHSWHGLLGALPGSIIEIIDVDLF